MNEGFWRNQPDTETVSRAMTLEDLQRGAETMQLRDREPPLHLLYGTHWCDLCGPREFWTHGHPDDK